MVSSVTCLYDVLESENILVHGPLVQYFHICALKGIGASDLVAYCTQLRMIWLVIIYGAICPPLLPDRIAYCTSISMSWFHMIPYGYAHSLFNIMNNPSILSWFQFHMRRTCMMFLPKFHVYKHILSTYYKWLLVELLFNIFIFKLLEFNINVHLCFNYIVLLECYAFTAKTFHLRYVTSYWTLIVMMSYCHNVWTISSIVIECDQTLTYHTSLTIERHYNILTCTHHQDFIHWNVMVPYVIPLHVMYSS